MSIHWTSGRPVLLLGASGQVGSYLHPLLADRTEVVAPGRGAADLLDFESLRRTVHATNPALIVNAAAYTAVDRAEDEPDVAMRANAEAVGLLGALARDLGAAVVHYSTDYVFDGTLPRPYTEHDAPNPLSVYGATKLAGELALLSSGAAALVIRTSWVYGAGGKNFMLRMLELANDGRTLRVVDDQIGAPTSSRHIAEATVRTLDTFATSPAGLSEECRRSGGVYHLTAAGETSWYGFARAIMERAGYDDAWLASNLVPISTAEFGAAARRPANSLLDNTRWTARFGWRMSGWQEQLDDVMRDLRGVG